MKKQTIERAMFYIAKPNIFQKAEELRKNITELNMVARKKGISVCTSCL